MNDDRKYASSSRQPDPRPSPAPGQDPLKRLTQAVAALLPAIHRTGWAEWQETALALEEAEAALADTRPAGELKRLVDAFWAWELTAHSAETDMAELVDAHDMWDALIAEVRRAETVLAASRPLPAAGLSEEEQEVLDAAIKFVRIPGQYPKHGPGPEWYRLNRAVEDLARLASAPNQRETDGC